MYCESVRYRVINSFLKIVDNLYYLKLNSSGGLWPPQAAMLLVETIWLGAAEAFTSATVRVKKAEATVM